MRTPWRSRSAPPVCERRAQPQPPGICSDSVHASRSVTAAQIFAHASSLVLIRLQSDRRSGLGGTVTRFLLLDPYASLRDRAGSCRKHWLGARLEPWAIRRKTLLSLFVVAKQNSLPNKPIDPNTLRVAVQRVKGRVRDASEAAGSYYRSVDQKKSN